MKLVTTIIRPEKLAEVKAALFRAGVTAISRSRVRGTAASTRPSKPGPPVPRTTSKYASGRFSVKYVAGNLVLWLIAFVTVLVTTGGLGPRLGPVFAVCMIGSSVLVRKGVGLATSKLERRL
jgi:hypothetical protein